MAFLVIPNLPYALWLGRFTPTRAVVNIDYLILGILCYFLSPGLLIALFIFIGIIDAFVFISTLYHFTPRELIMSMNYARYSPIKIYDLPVIDIAAMAIFTGIAILLACKVRATKSRASSVVLFILLCGIILADICNGSNTYGPFTRLPFYTRMQRIGMNPANSGLLAADPASLLWIKKPIMTKAESASQVALRQWRGLPKRGTMGTNIALIVVESWGQIDGQQRLTRAIAAPLLTPAVAARYEVKIGSVAFHGSTTNAELRELCGVKGSYRDLFSQPRLRCLPDIFAGIGYDVTGMHGFYGDMFDRTSWWPSLGIRQSLFLDDFRRLGYVRTCGTAFPGLCDDDLVAAMANRLTSPRQFVYALTINSHLPLPRADDISEGLSCSALPISLHDAPCALAHQWRHVFTAIADNALRTDIKPTQFIVVGDHSPPLLGTSDQDFSPTRVPYILLTPRSVITGKAEGVQK